MVRNFRTPTNKVGFVLQLGYFAAVNRFFAASKFYLKDIKFVCQRLHIPMEKIELSKYVDRTFDRHQAIIIESLENRKFDDQCKLMLIDEALLLLSNQMKPRLMFMSLVDFLIKKK